MSPEPRPARPGSTPDGAASGRNTGNPATGTRAAKNRATGNRAVTAWTLLAWALLTTLWCSLILPRMVGPTQPPPFQDFSLVDFRDTVWIPARDFAAGGVPYDVHAYLGRHPYAQEFLLYTPHYFWLTWPLALLPLTPAAGLWIAGVTAAAVVTLVRVCLDRFVPALAARPWLVLLAAVVVSLSPPVSQAMRSGNWAIPCGLGVGLALLGRTRRTVVFGVLLALVKPPVALPLIVILLVQRRWRPVLTGLGIAAVASLPVGIVVLTRLGGIGPTVRVLLENASYAGSSPFGGAGADKSTRVDPVGALARAGIMLPDPWVTAVSAVALLGTVLLVWLTWRAFGPYHPVFLAAAGCCLLLGTPNELYAAISLVPALVASLAWAARSVRDGGPDRWWAVAVAGLILLPFVNVHRLHSLLGVPPALSGISNGLALTLLLGVLAAALLSRGPAAAEHPR